MLRGRPDVERLLQHAVDASIASVWRQERAVRCAVHRSEALLAERDLVCSVNVRDLALRSPDQTRGDAVEIAAGMWRRL
jgi:hypothetical protein